MCTVYSEGRRIFFGAIFINKLDIRLFGYSISERARAPILCEKGTVEYLSIADGLSRRNPEFFVKMT